MIQNAGWYVSTIGCGALRGHHDPKAASLHLLRFYLGLCKQRFDVPSSGYIFPKLANRSRVMCERFCSVPPLVSSVGIYALLRAEDPLFAQKTGGVGQ